MNIRSSIQELKDEIAKYRREMHMNPQTAYEEEFASGLVRDKLTAWGIDFEDKIAVTGIVATIESTNNTSGKSVGLRADMDALDIIEEENKPWHSKTPGKMHGCGHDGHTAMLLGAAKYLNENRDSFNGRVHLIFQPAEEGKKGAHKMMEEGLFDRFPCDSVYGVHNWPNLPKGKIATRPGPIMASADIINITVKGKGCHAAMPSRGVDPVVVGAHIVTALQTLVSRYSPPQEPVVLSMTNFHAGTGMHNVIPDDAKLIGTLRCYNQDLRLDLKDRIGHMAKQIAASMGADIEYDFRLVLDPTINDAGATAFCADIARDLVGSDMVDDNVTPSMGGEDFGAMMFDIPGCYIWIGQGEDATSPCTQNLHTPRYDFNDDIIPLGIEYWIRIVEKSMPAA